MSKAAIRNVAIIAHVDHGKTTLVDAMLKQAGGLAGHREVIERVMDSDDLEKERGITILGKATSIQWGDTKINIADTPGHADFGGEVERMLTMVDGVVLLVDAAEGPLPQTRFVLGKALAAGLSTIVVVNKIDRGDARPAEVLDEVYDLFIDLDAAEEQIEFPVLYTNARAGTATADLSVDGTDLRPLMEAIVEHTPAPEGDPEAPLQALVTSLDYDNYLGRLGIGRVRQGTMREGDFVQVLGEHEPARVRLQQLYVFDGLSRKRVKEVPFGELFSLAGIDVLTIGDTIADDENPVALPRVRVDEPTIGMLFRANTGPFSGREGKYVTSRNLRDRLDKELRANVGLRVEETEERDAFRVLGRGELALSILIENMRREGYELCVAKPEVVTRRSESGELLEPIETLLVDIIQDHLGAVTQLLAPRKGIMGDMKPLSHDRVRVEFSVPSRGLIGFRSSFLNVTRGTGIMNTLLAGWEPWKGEIAYRTNGAIVADRTGVSTTYALFNLQPRGKLFIGAQVEVYEGMVIGERAKSGDLDVNGTREKQLNNIRAAGKDEALVLAPPIDMSLEEALQWISDDELVEVTPSFIRIRKKVLAANQRPKREKDAV